MKVVYVTPSFPYPPDRGDRIRSFHLIREISKAHDCVLVSFLRQGEEDGIGKMKRFCRRIETVPHPGSRAYLKAAPGVVSPVPQQIIAASSPALKKTLAKVMAEEQPDILHIHSLQFAPYAEPYDVPKVIDLVETMTFMYEKMLPHRADIKSLIYKLELKKVRNYECSRLTAFDRVLVMSLPIKEYLMNIGCNARVDVVRVGIDTDYFTPAAVARDKDRMVFVGTMAFYQNVDGITYFCKEILPLIKRVKPSVKLWIIGGDPPPVVKALAGIPGVEVTGYVDDIRPYLNEASVYVAPIRIATGLHAKILEAMSLGLPVAATPQSCEGMGVIDGEQAMLAAAPDDFAAKVLRLMGDEEIRQKVGENGRLLVHNNYTSARSAKDLERVYKEITEDRQL